MMKKTVDAFVECQKSVVNEINYARNELICGRYEEAYNILTNLSDEITTDIRISEGKFETVLDRACKNYAKKELNNTPVTKMFSSKKAICKTYQNHINII